MQMIGEIRVPVSADRGWDLVGTRFGEVARWAAPITNSVLDRAAPEVGAVRTCQVSGFGPMGDMVVRERLLTFDHAARSLTYDAVYGMPAFVRRATNTWTVTPDGPDSCVVRTRAQLALAWWMRPLGPLLAPRMHREARLVLQDLAFFVETGRLHPRAAPRRADVDPASGASAPGAHTVEQ